MFWGSQTEDLEHRKMAEGQKNEGDLNGERGDSKGDRRDSKGRLLPNPVLCCESLSVRATAQVNPEM